MTAYAFLLIVVGVLVVLTIAVRASFKGRSRGEGGFDYGASFDNSGGCDSSSGDCGGGDGGGGGD